MKNLLKIAMICLSLMIIIPSCATQKQQKSHCGTKQQKKAKHKSMKSGNTPGGGMLSK